jgi:hypothetical protein
MGARWGRVESSRQPGPDGPSSMAGPPPASSPAASQQSSRNSETQKSDNSASNPRRCLRPPVSGIRHPASGIRHLASGIWHPVSGLRPASPPPRQRPPNPPPTGSAAAAPKKFSVHPLTGRGDGELSRQRSTKVSGPMNLGPPIPGRKLPNALPPVLWSTTVPGLGGRPVLVQAGRCPFPSGYWGDYSATSIISGDSSFWTIQEYADPAPVWGYDWGTWVAQFKVSP